MEFYPNTLGGGYPRKTPDKRNDKALSEERALSMQHHSNYEVAFRGFWTSRFGATMLLGLFASCSFGAIGVVTSW
jgi:hypothetical protein